LKDYDNDSLELLSDMDRKDALAQLLMQETFSRYFFRIPCFPALSFYLSVTFFLMTLNSICANMWALSVGTLALFRTVCILSPTLPFWK
jgi:hypothetical protein